MAITVKKLYKNGSFLYKMNLIAGREGLENLVKWVHIIEDDNATSFLHGNELVFTAGILNHSENWLLQFAKKLYEAGTSAFVVNIGPHITEIPAGVAAYCNEVNMPLFTIPWETRMVDMTRDFCHRIMNNEHVQNNTASAIKNIIFGVGDMETQVLQLERYGYQRDSRFCFISLMTEEENSTRLDEHKDLLAKTAEAVAKKISELFITFNYKEYLIFVLVNYSDADIRLFVDELSAQSNKRAKDWSYYIGVSSNKTGIHDQKVNFERALSSMEMAKKRNIPRLFYDGLGIFKLLYAIDDKAVLREYYKNTVGKLEGYDRENKTQMMELLKTYLENNGSVHLVSEKLFVHRNTVNNQLKKVEEITGYNPLDLDDKVRFLMAFHIKDIL